ncbi:MAG: hypothetical protein LBB75_02575 [Oscillospiraceae bacterium]|jgi:predicted DNA binding CopG/RHH family protein|nr:hypothetical protein [Oscillospiraceae bacterium]
MSLKIEEESEIYIRITESLLRKVDAVCEKKNIPFNRFATIAIEYALEQLKD